MWFKISSLGMYHHPTCTYLFLFFQNDIYIFCEGNYISATTTFLFFQFVCSHFPEYYHEATSYYSYTFFRH